VVDVGDDGHVPEIVAHRHSQLRIPSGGDVPTLPGSGVPK
jgi:hypothetical protein